MMVNLRKKRGGKYLRNLIFIVLMFLFLVTSKMIFNEKNEQKETKLNSSVSLLDKSFTLVNHVYFSKNQTIMFEHYTTEDHEPLPEKIDVEAKKERGDMKKYSTKLYKISDNYLVCFVQNVPDKWTTLRVEITDNSKKNALTLTNDSLFLTRQSMKEQETLVIQSSTFYEEKSLDYLAEDTEKFIAKIEKDAEGKENEIEKIQTANTNLKGQLDIKTEEEKNSSLEQITTNESKIATLKTEIAKMISDKKALEGKLEKIKAKKQKLTKK